MNKHEERQGHAWVECSNCGHVWTGKSDSGILGLCANCFVENTAKLLSFYDDESGYVYTADNKRNPFEYEAICQAKERIDAEANEEESQ